MKSKVENLHVVQILDRGEEAGTPLLVLQSLPGGNLKGWCERSPSILSHPRLHYDSWLLPRPVEGDANKPFPAYETFDAMTGQLIEIGSTGRRRPVGGEPTAGSRPTEPPAATSPPAAGVPSLAGSRWRRVSTRSSAAVWDYRFLAGGRLEVVEPGPDFVEERGTWVQTGDRVEINLRSWGGSRTGTVNGNQIRLGLDTFERCP